mmetsp:Transcript_11920/g.36741  ORF Transcript_11920/g.36741 Transcript_11920/m.36741 type:complete len:135 (-) Transcript_11920:1584-1988(-)
MLQIPAVALGAPAPLAKSQAQWVAAWEPVAWDTPAMASLASSGDMAGARWARWAPPACQAAAAHTWEAAAVPEWGAVAVAAVARQGWAGPNCRDAAHISAGWVASAAAQGNAPWVQEAACRRAGCSIPRLWAAG